MRRIGFSTGALAKGDFERGLALHPGDCVAVSQSAGDAFRRLSSLVSEHIPIIIESMVEPCDIVDEVRIVREAFEGKPLSSATNQESA
jgi:hypothetical protein